MNIATVDAPTYSDFRMGADGAVEIKNSQGADIKLTTDGKVTIRNGSADLKTVVDALCTALTSWVNTGGSTPNAATVTAINAVKTSFDSLLS